MKPITIIGGGIAGLSLGTALARSGVPVQLYEAGSYPRHRVCGEFISGVDNETLQDLGIKQLLHSFPINRTCVWFCKNKKIIETNLPQPAYGVSRFVLDEALALHFQTNGGRLICNTRQHPNANEGEIIATGRIPQSSRWVGLKIHSTNLALIADLEIHLFPNGYLGMSKIESNRVNVCGLFRLDKKLSAPRHKLLTIYLESNGMRPLAERIDSSVLDRDSACAVTGFLIGYQPHNPDHFHIGDSQLMIPPFTGNGMSMSLEAAAIALPHLVRYAQETQSWEETKKQTSYKILRHFRHRMIFSQILHPFLYSALGQSMLVVLAKRNLIPFKKLNQWLRH